jgi:RNA polymerase sigma-70 factor, ECF subfamily
MQMRHEDSLSISKPLRPKGTQVPRPIGSKQADGSDDAENTPSRQASIDALGPVFDQHASALWRSLYVYSRSRSIAEDALAEAFALAVEQSAVIRDPLSWVRRVAFRLATKELKRRRLLIADDATILLADVAADTPRSTVEGVMDLTAGLWRLSPQQRAALLLRYREGLSNGEIADLLGISPATVRVHIYRATHRLQRLLEEETS